MNTNKDDRIADEVERTLHSFDNDGVLNENPFLASKILAVKESHLHERVAGSVLRIGLRYVVMLLILIVNVLTVVRYFEWYRKSDLQEQLVAGLREDLQIDQSQNSY
jgi:hypothetical protein